MHIFLVTVGFILILWSIVDFKKQKKMNKVKFEEKLMDAESDIDGVDLKIGMIRREFSETILELQEQIYEIKKERTNESQILRKKDVFIKSYEKNEKNKGKTEKDIENNNSEEKNQWGNIEEISKLISQGKSVDEISGITKMNKGEILLVKELYL